MTMTKKRRGRPPGTGIDDSEVLEQLREILKADPSMKPTTAIRALGFENESIIRRLRDKLRFETEKPDQQDNRVQQGSKTPTTTPWSHPAAGREQASVQLLGSSRDPVKTQPVRPPAAEAPRETAEQKRADGEHLSMKTADITAPLTSLDLPLQAFGAAIATANFFAIQNALWWQASLRRPPWGSLLVPKGQTCPCCGQTR